MGTRNTIIATILACAGLAQAAEAGSGGPTLKDIRVEQRPVVEITPPRAPGFKVSAWVDQEDLTYMPGERLTVFAQTTEDAYITILDIGTSGKVHVIFPNAFQPDNFVRAGQTVTIPGKEDGFDFTVDGPQGTEVLKVFATTRPGPITRATPTAPAGPFTQLSGAPDRVAKDISVTLRETQENRFAEYHKIIRIREPEAAGTVVGQAIAPRPVPGITPAVGGTAAPAAIRPATERFGLTISAERAVYHPGEPITLDVVAERDCNLTLVNVGSSGEARILFPNRYTQGARIAGGRITRIAGPSPAENYVVTGPEGIDTVVGVCLENDLAPLTVLPDFARDPYPSVGTAPVISRDIAAVLARPRAALGYAAYTLMVAP